MITRRAVLYIGHLCNIHCKFCYYLYAKNKTWFPLEKCKSFALSFKEDYGNNAVDITGGEPTIYPDILELVRYCREIGLKSTIITNCQVLTDINKVQAFKDAGIEDFLCSIHAWGDKYDNLVNKKGGFETIKIAIDNLNLLNINFRVNCVLTNESKDDLIQIASYAYNRGAKVINFISYNPFYEWAHLNVPDFQARHSIIAPYLKLALDYCNSVGLEANVRYFPFCQLAGHLDKCYNFSQLSYDPGEWDFLSWYSDKFDAPSAKYSDAYYKAFEDREELLYRIAQSQKIHIYASSGKCNQCLLYHLCDGLTRQYSQRFGDNELDPCIQINPIPKNKPDYFIATRKKYLWEKENKCLSIS